MNISKISILAFFIIAFSACKEPTENIKLVVDTDIIKYTAMVNVRDAYTGEAAPANATITVTGQAAPNVYELSGKKNIKLVAGKVTIGLHPDIAPTTAAPMTITVEIAAPGYVTQSKQITFTAGQRQQVAQIDIVKVGLPTPPVIPPPAPIYPDLSIDFTGVCPDRTDFQVRPSVYLYFRKLNSGQRFEYLGYMDKGNIKTKFLQLGETYEFQIVYGGNEYKVSQKIEVSYYALTIQMPGACNL
ncbi:MAG: hypothetical protein EOO90_18305 [Pedobacter sp.]|nr:MAG: hypothetical protein EOO90_18305 [Pedobacter sp.]